jgi:aryl-alcohol dehydrogenase-like predicted oxidoreductase
MWGGSSDRDSILAILRALELGITFIDTAPVYGFGHSEQIISEALKQWGRKADVAIATKCGLNWDDGGRNIWRDSSPERIRTEVEGSLKRLGVDCIHLLQIHWPDPKTPFDKSMEVLVRLQEAGKIRYIGLSNFNKGQLEACLEAGPVHSLQPPYNLFEREAEQELLPFCLEKNIATLAYGGLCRGLLSGKFSGSEQFAKGDLRRVDPKFKPDKFKQYVKAVEGLKKLAAKYEKTPAQFALRWALQQPGITTVIAGARTAGQVEDNAGAAGWVIEADDIKKVEEILQKHIKTPVGPEFMAPRKD